MTAHSIQLRKEARQLLWSWLLLILGGLLSLNRVSPSLYSWGPILLLNWLPPIGCFLGIPLLATLPIGIEFQNGTLTSLLAQPLERRQLWRQKITVSLIAILPVALLYLLAGGRNPDFMPDVWMAAAWMVATAAGAMVSTLIAKSTMGGFALSSGVYWILFFLWSYFADRQREDGVLPNSFLWASAIGLFSYSIVVILLGRWLFLRFQPVDGVLAGDALSPIARFLPRMKTNWLRSRPRGAILNLISKEMRLLKIVWLLSLLSLASWTFLVWFHFIPGRAEYFNIYTSEIPVSLAILLSFLIALLAGALSLGEEKTSGTYAWHLTLPLSASLQWFLKLFIAIVACLICALGAPLFVLVARGRLAGVPYSYLGWTGLWFWILMALFTTLLAFWCSCQVKGAVRAVLCFFPILFSMELAASLGVGMGDYAVLHSKTLVDSFLLKFDPFTDSRTFLIFLGPIDGLAPFLALALAPLLIVGLIQSLRAFVAPFDERKLRIVRNAVPLLVILLTSGFVLSTLGVLTGELRQEQIAIVHEAHTAIEDLLRNGNANVALHKFNVVDLERVSPLSDRTKHWLQDATILVHLEKVRPGNPPRIQWPFEQSFMDHGVRGKAPIPYAATIRTKRGSECSLSFWTSGQIEWGFLSESCQ
jgi:hypothetical protein